MSDANNEDLALVETWVKSLDLSDLINLWETLTNEVNNPSSIWDMGFFLDEYLPECLNSKSLDVVDLVRIVTGNDGCVKHFNVNDQYVYVNSLGLYESINEYDIADLVIDFINDYDLINYSDAIKTKLVELKEDSE